MCQGFDEGGNLKILSWGKVLDIINRTTYRLIEF